MSKFLYTLFCLIAFESAIAQTISWKCHPCWDSAEIFGENMLKVKQSGQWGVVSFSGSEIIPCENARITDISDGLFLLLDDHNKIISLRDNKCNSIFLTESGKKQKELRGDWYVDPAWPYFSEGLLAIRNSVGGWGFINTEGQLVIKSTYSKVYPFRYGQSTVKFPNKNWRHIDKNGNAIRDDQNLGNSQRTYMSSFTQIGKGPQSIVCVNDKMYLIDLAGNIQGDIVRRQGIFFSYLSENDSTISYTKDNFSIEFNNRGEITYIKNGDDIYTGTLKEYPAKGSFPTHEWMEIDKQGYIRIDSLFIIPQFQEFIPLSNHSALVKKDEKWGILEFDRSGTFLKIIYEKPFYTSSDSNLEFELSDNLANVRVYTCDAQKKITYFDVLDGIFKVPTNYLDENDQIALGIEEQGILLEPVVFTIPLRSLDKSKYKVTISSSTKKVKNMGTGSINITVQNEYEPNNIVPYNVYINGKLSKEEETDSVAKLQHKVQNIVFGDDEKKTIFIKVEIEEKGVQGKLSYSKSYTFEKQYDKEE